MDNQNGTAFGFLVCVNPVFKLPRLGSTVIAPTGFCSTSNGWASISGEFYSALSTVCEPAWCLKPFPDIFRVGSFHVNFSCKIYAKVITQPLCFQGALCHTRIFPAYPHLTVTLIPVFQFLLACSAFLL